jgi:HlyD family secretion protein
MNPIAPKPSKFSAKRLAILLSSVLILLAAFLFLSRDKPIDVQIYTVARGNIEAAVSNTRAGTVKACRRAKLSPPAGGQISQMRVKKGDHVAAGQILLELWHDDLSAQKQLAQDQLHSAEIRVREICTQADTSKREADRAKELRAKGFISQQQVERAEVDATSRQASCDGTRSDITQSKSRIALAEATLNRMVLRAPFAGVVADISGELGEYATPSPPGIPTLPAIDLIDDSCLFVSAPIDEVDAAKVKVGQTGRIVLDAIKGHIFVGKVKRIAPYVLELEKQARTVEVEVEFVDRNKADALLIGYSADVELIYETHANVVRVPTQTLLEGGHVLVINNDGKLEKRTVSSGLSNWEFTEITAGLKGGERLVTSLDRTGVKAGALVSIEAETAKK